MWEPMEIGWQTSTRQLVTVMQSWQHHCVTLSWHSASRPLDYGYGDCSWTRSWVRKQVFVRRLLCFLFTTWNEIYLGASVLLSSIAIFSNLSPRPFCALIDTIYQEQRRALRHTGKLDLKTRALTEQFTYLEWLSWPHSLGHWYCPQPLGWTTRMALISGDMPRC